MEQRTSVNHNTSISDIYRNYFHSVCTFINYRINNHETAKDLAQDVFLRLMDYKQMLCPETAKNFIYTIAANLATDHLRTHYRRQKYASYMYEHATTARNDVESKVIARDIAAVEHDRCSKLSAQRSKVYSLNRFEGKSIHEISKELNLSSRTVENHLFASRKEIRRYIRCCI